MKTMTTLLLFGTIALMSCEKNVDVVQQPIDKTVWQHNAVKTITATHAQKKTYTITFATTTFELKIVQTDGNIVVTGLYEGQYTRDGNRLIMEGPKSIVETTINNNTLVFDEKKYAKLERPVN